MQQLFVLTAKILWGPALQKTLLWFWAQFADEGKGIKGEHLVRFAMENSLSFLNTFHPGSSEKIADNWTCSYDGKRPPKQIDYVLVDTDALCEWTSSVTDSSATDSDHRIICGAKNRISRQQKYVKNKTKSQKRKKKITMEFFSLLVRNLLGGNEHRTTMLKRWFVLFRPFRHRGEKMNYPN